MKEYLEKISETKEELSKLEFFKIAVNSICLLLISAIGLQFFRLPLLYAPIPPISYFMVKFTKRETDKKIIAKVGNKYPNLEEQLKTAYDNKENEGNVIVQDLLKEVSEDVGKVKSSKFLNNREILKKVAICTVLTFVLLSINFFQFSIYSLGLGYDPSDLLRKINSATGGLLPGEIIPQGKENSKEWEASNYTTEEEKKKIGGEGGGGKIPGFSKGPIPGSGGGAGTKPGTDIFGDPSSAEILGEEIKMEMHPEYGGEIEIREERAGTPLEDFALTDAKGAKSPTKDPLKYEEIIKRYFEKLLEEEGGG